MKKKLPLLLAFALFAFTQSTAQIQKGLGIDGDSAYNRLGWCVTMPDALTLAVGAPFNSGIKQNAGNVKVYRWKDTAWVQKGMDIQGGAEGDASGRSISMPDSNTIAIGAHRNITDSIQAGRVRIHKWNGSNWVQKGADITGENNNDNFGYSVSMPDSNYVSIGGYDNDGNGNNSGHVRNFRWNGVDWIQMGLDIEGDTTGDQSGWSISTPDSLTVAIGAPKNDGNGPNSGHARIYQRTGSTWIQKGLTIEGDTAGNESGWSVNMPNKNTIAIGSIYHWIGGGRNSKNVGQVRIFSWDGSNWVQKGTDLIGIHSGSQFGYSINMPDSNTVAIGIPRYSHFNPSGTVYIYRWNGNAWVQKGNVFNGQATGDLFGYSVCMPDTNTVAIGAPINSNSNGTQAGHARVYWFCNSTDTLTLQACMNYTSPSGKYTWNTNGIYKDTLVDLNGCKTFFTINLTIVSVFNINLSPAACSSYTSPSGKYTWTTSGIYKDTIPDPTRCDSIFNINLTINNSSNSNISPSACDSYTSPSGNYTWTTSGNYKDTIPNSYGCDSVISIILTIDTHSVDTSLSKVNATLTANAINASYQWIYCDSNYIPVPGATDQSFTPSLNGYYAVIITQNNCVDTSACEGVFNVGIEEYRLAQIKVYPNPSKEKITIELGENKLNASIRINSINGKLVYEEANVRNRKKSINVSNFPNGIYIISIQIGDTRKEIKLVKN